MPDTATENKVQFNLKNVHYALMQSDGSYSTPVAIPGAVSLSLDPDGDTKPFYADGIKYYTSVANNGYSGDLEMALLPPAARKALWNIEEDSADHVLIERSSQQPAQFALLFQIDGDQQAALNVLYNCTASRPKIESKTDESGKEVQTQKCKIDAAPLTDGKVMASTTASTPSAVISNWFASVWTGTQTAA